MDEITKHRTLIEAEVAAIEAANEERADKIAALELETEEGQTRIALLKGAITALQVAEEKLMAIGPLTAAAADGGSAKTRIPIKKVVIAILEAANSHGYTVDQILAADTEGMSPQSVKAFLYASRKEGVVTQDDQSRWRLVKRETTTDAEAPAAEYRRSNGY